MSSPSSSTKGLVSANIKLFNSKSDNDTQKPTSNYLPPLPPKPTKKSPILDTPSLPPPLPPTITTSHPHISPPLPPSPPPLPPVLPSSLPPPLPATPPRPIHRNGVNKTPYHHTKKPIHSSTPTLSSSLPSSLSSSTVPSPIVAQRSGSTLKGMLGKVVGSVSGKLIIGKKLKLY